MSSAIQGMVKETMKQAMKAKAKERLAAIRLIQAEFKRIEVDERIELDDARVLVILDKMIKQRRDSSSQYASAGREDLAQQEDFEISVISEFLPKPYTEEEIRALVEEAINNVGASGMQAMGLVMAELKPKLQGRADMGKVSQQLKTLLQA